MQNDDLHELLSTLATHTTGRARWITDPDRTKATFCPRPGEVNDTHLPPGHPPIQTHIAAEAFLQTDALCVIAAALVRIADLLTKPAETP